MEKVKIEKYRPSHLPHELKHNLKSRINRAKGHLESIVKMIEEDRPCEEIVLQLVAVKSAVNETIISILEGHLEMYQSDPEEYKNLDTIEIVKILTKVLRSK
ncbi:MAG: metal-sensitive transcriptional regulator [Spirochaetia bacterium]|nr:metal-sensitive transcriptional regulator [Spirochaetota bacterium]MCX8096381.1 metal-sensitive transcriptional regulator [Spirochaetota bacterium]MDW8112957.1 metal-sensitive transcriptional regulator [Spirochaetia bacterium]